MSARIVLLDIETSPNLGYVWGKYEQNVIEYTKEWDILCYGWKDLGADETQVVARPDFDSYDPDSEDDGSEEELCNEIWCLLDEADVVIAHNGDKFDIRKINARLLYYGFASPSPYQTIDTLKLSRRYFALNSHKLGDVGEHLGIGKKEYTGGFETWKGCMRGDPEAWATMTKYCGQDVVLLEDFYNVLLPWIQGGPNMALLNGEIDACPICGEVGGMTRQGERKARTMTYQRWLCTLCTGWSRTVKSERNAEKPRFTN